jgi:hypothetical protein
VDPVCQLVLAERVQGEVDVIRIIFYEENLDCSFLRRNSLLWQANH